MPEKPLVGRDKGEDMKRLSCLPDPRPFAGRVAAGAIAERYLKLAYGVEIVSFVSSVGNIHMPTSSRDDDVDDEDYLKFLRELTREKVDGNTIRCPHVETAKLMEEVS